MSAMPKMLNMRATVLKHAMSSSVHIRASAIILALVYLLYAICLLPCMCQGEAMAVIYADVSAGRSAQSAARSLDAAGAQMADAAAARMDKIGQELLRDVQEGLQSNASMPLKQLSTLNAKLEVCTSHVLSACSPTLHASTSWPKSSKW